MSVSVAYALTATITEVLETNTSSAATTGRTLTHGEFNESGTLNSGTTPPVTKQASFIATLSSGSLSVDLTSLTGTNGATVDGTGLRVQLLRVKNLGANALTVAGGASNGYDAWGGDFLITIPQNGIFQIYGNDAGSDIGSSYKTLDLSGTGTQTSEWTVVMG